MSENSRRRHLPSNYQGAVVSVSIIPEDISGTALRLIRRNSDLPVASQDDLDLFMQRMIGQIPLIVVQTEYDSDSAVEAAAGLYRWGEAESDNDSVEAAREVSTRSSNAFLDSDDREIGPSANMQTVVDDQQMESSPSCEVESLAPKKGDESPHCTSSHAGPLPEKNTPTKRDSEACSESSAGQLSQETTCHAGPSGPDIDTQQRDNPLPRVLSRIGGIVSDRYRHLRGYFTNPSETESLSPDRSQGDHPDTIDPPPEYTATVGLDRSLGGPLGHSTETLPAYSPTSHSNVSGTARVPLSPGDVAGLSGMFPQLSRPVPRTMDNLLREVEGRSIRRQLEFARETVSLTNTIRDLRGLRFSSSTNSPASRRQPEADC